MDVGDEQDPKAKKGPKAVVEQVSYFRLYRFATPLEVIMVLFGTLCALAAGALQPLSILVFGNIIDAFGPSSDLLTNITTSAVQMTVLGCISFVCASSQVTMFVYTGSHQASRIRALYFRSILRQEMQWYDGGATGELTTRISGYAGRPSIRPFEPTMAREVAPLTRHSRSPRSAPRAPLYDDGAGPWPETSTWYRPASAKRSARACSTFPCS